ncbi:DUF1450 domain-containing protein [Alicyclobacillus ferrooxydans]|uniref:UDP-N-acetylmuramoylalanine--D-glutamate ligase n=1 Tax=Alicyclobacillus ferrooxydans TaxID=471514 RepID=A0A0P9D6H9_9BACL|nr:DUF1450 domain-containing protein [Alicyclobacillus ferrooxydans]KPV44994.1 hypothetical protein AN477_04275 [Alicyclobacillus ferrooxydans]
MESIKKLEVCISNLEVGTQMVWDRIGELFPDIRLIRWGCLGYCHRCIHVPYVLLNDTEYIEAQTVEELLEKVIDRIEKGSVHE